MKIKYEMECGSTLCFTICPNLPKITYPCPTRVNSAACKQCDHYISRDEKKQIVKCSFK